MIDASSDRVFDPAPDGLRHRPLETDPCSDAAADAARATVGETR
ncbi:hypothetical protein [Natrinema salsiterrestre]|nr:hypothetical protein [Natrinema salsiterrestre]